MDNSTRKMSYEEEKFSLWLEGLKMVYRTMRGLPVKKVVMDKDNLLVEIGDVKEIGGVKE